METRLEVVFWDVGQGDCSTLQLPDGSLVIIDTGPRGSPLIDWLNDHPGKKIRAVILTHNDSDHVGALPSLIGSFKRQIAAVFMLADRPVNDPVFNSLFRIVAEGEQQGYYAIRRLEAGMKIWAEPVIESDLEVRHPSMVQNILAGSPNQTSAVLALRWKGFDQIIWPGDAHLARVAEVCPSSKPMVLFGPHHGAPADGHGPKIKQAIDCIQPNRVFVSVASNNQYSHPNNRYLRSLVQANCRVVCSQITRQCDPVAAKHHILQSHLLLGLRPPRSGYACRGAMRLLLTPGGFVPDHLDAEHARRVALLRRPLCLPKRH
jgi:competence protein ComEC